MGPCWCHVRHQWPHGDLAESGLPKVAFGWLLGAFLSRTHDNPQTQLGGHGPVHLAGCLAVLTEYLPGRNTYGLWTKTLKGEHKK